MIETLNNTIVINTFTPVNVAPLSALLMIQSSQYGNQRYFIMDKFSADKKAQVAKNAGEYV